MSFAGRTWLFDLDNTLHNATPHIFPHINRSMRQYIERHLGVDESEATRIRQDYWIRYGATLRRTDAPPRHRPQAFFVGDTSISRSPAHAGFRETDAACLRKLPGKKILFSNAPRHYTDAILK
jgi:putative hydrolase of the HAD superfamily